ncbi:uncharacterized protein METZ01_LOCUS411142 [marine metagenome]|uniref:Uncharacterized protein n=1 Tax=marine metagenome TaxID=408172 RepID=A0A382WJK4_9ZZZZ
MAMREFVKLKDENDLFVPLDDLSEDEIESEDERFGDRVYLMMDSIEVACGRYANLHSSWELDFDNGMATIKLDVKPRYDA